MENDKNKIIGRAMDFVHKMSEDTVSESDGEKVIKELESIKNDIVLADIGRNFIKELIEKEEVLKSKLSENLDFYMKKASMIDYDKTFSQWNKCNLVLWDLKDILCRMGEDMD